jgi:hypothetical protein
MAVQIVNVSVTEQVAPAPITLQQTGAIVSQGATNLNAGEYAILTRKSDLSAILASSEAITTITWLASVVTVTTTAPHGIPISDVVGVTISGMTPAGYNGTFLATSTGASTFTYPLVANPGLSSVVGVYTLADVAELNAQVTTFFTQGATASVYVLELGIGDAEAGVTALDAYITAPTLQFYSYLIPRSWNTEPTAPQMMATYSGTTSLVYFYVTTTVATYSTWETIKSVVALVESPQVSSLEFTMSALWWNALSRNPNASAMMTQLQYAFVYGVTPYTTLTNPQKVALTAAGVNWIDTGAEGQISRNIIKNGKYMDLKPFSYWYSVDWVNVHEHVALAAEIINGSNRPQNPLNYDQPGVNALQKVAQSVMDNGISFGLLLAPVAVDAVPFVTYIAQNPSDYSVGAYNGLSCTFVPARGFDSITIYLTASDIPT